MERIITYTVTKENYQHTHGHVGFILRKELKLSRHEIARLKFQDGLSLDGKKVYINDYLDIGDTLTITFFDRQVKPIHSLLKPEILYEDEDIIIVNKPSGIPVHPSKYHLDDSLGTIVQSYMYEKNESIVIHVVGRLDKDVSGIVVFAKNRYSAALLNKQRQDGILKKTYLAYARGNIKQDGMFNDELDDKCATTRYRVIERYGDYTLVEVSIDTGRMHQIRKHFALANHPLLGDSRYGENKYQLNRVALHCHKVELISPILKKDISIEVPFLIDVNKTSE